MTASFECFNTRSEITKFLALENNLLALGTRYHGIKVLSAQDCKTKYSIKNKYINAQTTALSFSPDGKLLCFSSDNTIHILHMPSAELLRTIRIQDEEITILEFDSSSTYIIAGTKSGRVFQYMHTESSLLARLCSFSNKKSAHNPIGAFAFYDKLLACGGDFGSIYLINIYSKSNKIVLKNGNSYISALCFLDEYTLISANTDGNIYVSTFKHADETIQINTPFENISQIILMPNPDFILINTQTDSLALVDIKKRKIIQSRYIQLQDEIQTVALASSSRLFLALKNNRVLGYELLNTARLKSLIVHNSLDEAFELVNSEPMFKNSEALQELEESYQKIYLRALDALKNQNKSLAIQLTDMFKTVACKKDEIKQLFSAFEHYPRFKTLFLEKKYALAYAMSTKFPPLQQTHQYIQMENIWRETFKNAQRHILLQREDDARSLLKDYAAVSSKREIIQLILKNNKLFIEFLKAVGDKEYKKVHDISKKHNIFTQIPSYLALQNEIERSIKEIAECINKGEITLAKQYLSKIENIDTLDKKVKELHAECDYVLHLQTAYAENDFYTCYTLLDSHISLSSTQLGGLLQNHWIKLIKKCESYALKANIKDIKTALGDLLCLPSRLEKTGDLLRVSFHVKIKLLLAKKNFKSAENIIYSYIDIFGLDTDIMKIMHIFELNTSVKLAITQDASSKRQRDDWIHSKLIVG
ncbi:hypothetical protein KJ877_01815 [bacterium]|nr:hypothetical protein [bacterium]MBU1990882.1 hypothetical protein [bacterium]